MTNLKRKRIFSIFWILFSLPFIGMITLLILANTGALGFMPDFDDLENPKANLASEVYSSDGVLLGKFYKENRTVVEFTEISPNVLNALIATEDVRYYSHSGVDARALARVIKGLVTGNRQGGGSTISQQLAKNLFPRDKTKRSSIGRKINMVFTKAKEWSTAAKLERSYTKKEILAMYLNTVFFGSNAYGLKSAARTFFNTTPDSLKLEEAAVIVGLLKAPSDYNPRFNPKDGLERRNTVLAQIEKFQDELHELHGYNKLTTEQYDSLQALPITLDYTVQSHSSGGSNYFREFLRIIMTKKKPVWKKGVTYGSPRYKRYVSDSIDWATNPLYGWCNKNTKPGNIPYNLYEDGLKIYTTINSRMQKYAEDAVTEHMGETLQPLFYKRQKHSKKAPYTWKLTDKQIEKIYYTTVRRSERYRLMKLKAKKEKKKLDSAFVRKVFDIPVKMKVFTWQGDRDTTMTPWDSIVYYKYFLRAGFMSMEPQTGYVKAYVGGINYKHFRFDHVTLSRRQVGSTFKPFIYAVAMENKISPCHKIPNIPVTIPMPEGQDPYTPKFSKSRRDGEMITYKYGLAQSLNQVSAKLMRDWKPLAVVEMAHRAGITSPLDTVPSLCVGAAEVRLSEMVASYSTFCNKGLRVEPIFVHRIADKNGNIVTTFKAKQKEVLSENTAYRMTELMKGVVDMGTSVRLRYTYGFKNEMAGKTGTTNDNSDGWFIGFVPNLVSGAWVGGEERGIRFPSTADGQGASMALPIWAKYMKKCYADKNLKVSKARFSEPQNPDGVISDCKEYEQENADNGFHDPDEY